VVDDRDAALVTGRDEPQGHRGHGLTAATNLREAESDSRAPHALVGRSTLAGDEIAGDLLFVRILTYTGEAMDVLLLHAHEEEP